MRLTPAALFLMTVLVLPQFGAAGKLALQLHSGPAMTVQFKDLRLKKL